MLFHIGLVSLLFVATSATTFAMEGLPAYLNLIDPSGKFGARMIKGTESDQCEKTNYTDSQGFKYIGCFSNLTRFEITYKYEDKGINSIAMPGSGAAYGFTFPVKGKEIPGWTVNTFCGKSAATDNYNIKLSILPQKINSEDSWVVTLTIKEKEKTQSP